MIDLTKLHNEVAPAALRALVKPYLDAGVDKTALLVALESVIVGTLLICARLGGDEVVVDTLMQGVKDRLASQRLENIMPEGSA